MCPAMTEEPISPGRGLPVYQPATEVLDGTWSVPCRVMPSVIRLVCTPIAGMVRDTGAGAAAAGRRPGRGRRTRTAPGRTRGRLTGSPRDDRSA